MRWLFWVGTAVSAVAAILAMIPAVVIVTTFWSGFLLGPVWLAAANLWWVMGLLAPLVWYRDRGRLRVGVAVSVGLAVAAVAAFYGLRSVALAAIEPPFLSAEGALSGQPPGVVEIVVAADGVLGEAACDALCERLLTGNAVTAVRRVVPLKDGRTLATVFRRMDTADCLALDPEFPATGPCLLLAPDDGKPADLRITVEGSGDGYASRDEVGGLVYLVSARRVRVERLEAGQPVLLHDQSRRTWFEAVAPVPLLPNSGFDGDGLHGGGLAPLRQRKSDPVQDVAGILAGLGVPLGAGRPFVETKPGLTIGSGITLGPEGYFEAQPYDVALIASLLARGGPLDEGLSQMVGDWIERLEHGAPDRATTRALIGRLPSVLGDRTIMLQRLSLKRPELFVAQFADFYDQVRSGNDEVSRLAANAILNRVRSDPFGTHDAEAEAYRAALNSRRQWGYMIQVVGRYGFDPTPIFEAELAAPQPDLFNIFHAACRSDPKWADTLAPFLHRTLVPLLDDVERNRDNFRQASIALTVLGRAILVQDLSDRVDWDKVMANYDSQAVLDRVKPLYFRTEANANDC